MNLISKISFAGLLLMILCSLYPANNSTISFFQENKKPKPKNETGYFIDERDSTRYKWVKIGEQIWMAENLKFNYNSGTYAYDNNPIHVKKLGYLYTFEVLPKIAPDGWHIPSDEEWQQLEKNLGMAESELSKEGQRGKDEGLKLKIGGPSGFNAEMGGYRSDAGLYANKGKSVYYWTSTESSKQTAVLRCIYNDTKKILRNKNGYKTFADYVRCVKDPQ